MFVCCLLSMPSSSTGWEVPVGNGCIGVTRQGEGLGRSRLYQCFFLRLGPWEIEAVSVLLYAHVNRLCGLLYAGFSLKIVKIAGAPKADPWVQDPEWLRSLIRFHGILGTCKNYITAGKFLYSLGCETLCIFQEPLDKAAFKCADKISLRAVTAPLIDTQLINIHINRYLLLHRQLSIPQGKDLIFPAIEEN